jgi:hypothetical protein
LLCVSVSASHAMISHGLIMKSDVFYAVEKQQDCLGTLSLEMIYLFTWNVHYKNLSTLTSDVQTSFARSLSELRMFTVVMMIDM